MSNEDSLSALFESEYMRTRVEQNPEGRLTQELEFFLKYLPLNYGWILSNEDPLSALSESEYMRTRVEQNPEGLIIN